MPDPAIGTRISLLSQRGTILYSGTVAGTKGTWLGVEWDDPSRGKHSGSHNGVHYFTCRVEGAGSFIRPTAAGLSYGRSFMTALVDKYVEPVLVPPTSSSGAQLISENKENEKEVVLLGSSQGLIEVEAVGLDKVRAKLRQLDRLRDVSLDGELVADAGKEEEVREGCPRLKTLDLSRNLISNWETVVLIVQQLEFLESLSLNQNRFLPLPSSLPSSWCLPSVKILQVNDTLLPFPLLLQLSPIFPNLQELQAGFNQLSTLSLPLDSPKPSFPPFAKLKTLNLESNLLTSLPPILDALSQFPSLERLILAYNPISSIPFPPGSTPPPKLLKRLQYLSLASTPISSLACITALNVWLPHLPSLSIVHTPLLTPRPNNTSGASAAHTPQVDDKTLRALLISSLSSLTTLNGTPVPPAERSDSERFFLSYFTRASAAELRALGWEGGREEHPRWRELVERHGDPSAGGKGPAAAAGAGKGRGEVLANKLVTLHLALLDAPPVSADLPPRDCPTATLRALPSMTLRALRAKAGKLLKLPPKRAAELWGCSAPFFQEGEGAGGEVKEEGQWIVELMEGDGETLERWGLGEGDWVVLVPS